MKQRLLVVPTVLILVGALLGAPPAAVAKTSKPAYATEVAAGLRPGELLVGTVLLGGGRDRMINHDTIIAPKTTAHVRALSAASRSDIREEPAPFQRACQIAPVYLRRKADFGGSSSTVTTFIARNLDFRNDGAERKSLAANGSSSILQTYTTGGRGELDVALAKMGRPDGVIVGWILALRGRLQSLVVFGDPAVAAGYRAPSCWRRPTPPRPSRSRPRRRTCRCPARTTRPRRSRSSPRRRTSSWSTWARRATKPTARTPRARPASVT